jgi:alpha-tubulin suppressor-like RCC1 family protein
MINADSGGTVTWRARTLRSWRVKPGISSRSRWPSALAACALLCAAACRDSNSIPTTGPTHFVLTAAGALELGGAGSATACVLTLFEGTAYCWGYNTAGNFGNGSIESSNVPVPAGSTLRFAALGLGLWRSCGIEKSSLALYCWGSNGPSGRNPNDLTPELAPVLVDSSHKFKEVSQGSGSGCALTVDEDAYCWGGGGSRTFVFPLLKVPGGHAFKAIGVGDFEACGLTTQGDAYCWPRDVIYGETTDGIIGTPQLVAGQHHFISLSVGSEHACGLTQTGEAFCWGSNWGGQLGIGARDDDPHVTPEPVGGNLTFSALGAGAGATCAITPAGVAYCWGYNSTGALGNGTTDDSYVPVKVEGNMTFVSIGSGNGSACGITSNGDVYCWGYNQYGELGNGTNTESLVPEKALLTPTP